MAPLRIAVLPSARLGAVLCALHGVAGALGAILPVPVWSKAALFAAIAWSLITSLEKHALLRASGAIVGVDVTRKGAVIARTCGGGQLECEVLASSFVSHRLTILSLRSRGDRRERHVIMSCGNVNEADLRRLRVWLRWAAPTSTNHEA